MGEGGNQLGNRTVVFNTEVGAGGRTRGARTEQRGLHGCGVWAGPLVRVERGEDTPGERRTRTEARAKDSPRRLRGSPSGLAG